jgi:hypothetical protein
MPHRVTITIHENDRMDLDAGGLTMDQVEGVLLRALTFCQRTLTVAALKSSLTSGIATVGRLPRGPMV